MTFNELNPVIQSWIDSDEFIDSLVSVVKEFNLSSSAPLSDSIINLVLKTLRPEEFKAKLLASLPPEKQNDSLITRLVNLSLLPIKNPLAESGIDISVIAPLDEANVVPYSPDAKLSKEQDETVKALPAEDINNSPLSISEDEAATSPTEKQEETIEVAPVSLVETSPISASISPIESISTPIEPLSPVLDESVPLIPNFNTSATSRSTLPLTIEPSPAPFIIHEEKAISGVSVNSHKESLIRPMFYSGEQEIKRSAPTVSIEFGETKDAKKINPANIVDLNNLSS